MEATYQPTYTMDAQQRQATQAQIDQWTADCLSTPPQGGSDYDKALGIYTYVVNHADYQTVDSNSIVNIMVGGGGLQRLLRQDHPVPPGPGGHRRGLHRSPTPGTWPGWTAPLLDRPHLGDPVFTGGSDSQGPAYEYFGLTTDDLLRTHTIDETVPVPVCTSDANNYFVRQGLLFPSYSFDALASALQRAIAAGESTFSVRYTDEAYPRRLRRPLRPGEVHTLFRQAKRGRRQPPESHRLLWYSRNQDMGVLTFLLPYA